MSILIEGMSMPTSCAACPMLEGDRDDGLCHAASRWLDDDEYWTWYVYSEGDVDTSKPVNCPLVEISPHGRLNDADALAAHRPTSTDPKPLYAPHGAIIQEDDTKDYYMFDANEKMWTKIGEEFTKNSCKRQSSGKQRRASDG